MCRCRTDGFVLILGLASAALGSCGLVDLRPVTVSIEPDEPYATLPSRDSPVSVSFSAEPVRLEAEAAFEVSSASGAVEGDFSWDGSGFSWRPVSPWDPGVRYRARLGGSIRMADGRLAEPGIDLPFFAVRSCAPPILESFSPADGESVGVAGDGAPALTLTFSEAMDGMSVRDALSLRPAVAFDLRWNDAMSAASLIPKEALSPCASYTWTLGASARAADGAPLPGPRSASFATDLDSEPPRVVRAYPAVLSGGSWVEAAPSLSGLDSGHSIALLFSEPVEPRSAIAGVRVEPSVSGRVELVAQDLAVFIPDGDWEPEAELRLVVSDGLEDRSGLRMRAEYSERFVPLVPYLRILRVEAGGGESADDLEGDAVLQVRVGAAPDGGLIVTIEFSAPFDAEAKLALADKVSLSAFFPTSLPAPALKSVSWPSDDAVSFEWVGLEGGDASSEHYYLLSVSGGADGAASGSGLLLKEDASIYLEAQP